MTFIIIEQVSEEFVSQLFFAGAIVGQCVEQFVFSILPTELVYLFPLPLCM